MLVAGEERKRTSFDGFSTGKKKVEMRSERTSEIYLSPILAGVY